MKTLVAFIGLAALAPLAGAHETILAPVDREYLQTVAEDNIAELQLASMVARRAHSAQVRQAAQRMVRDHTKEFGQVRQLALRFSVELPREPNAKHKALFQHLSNMTPRELDSKFTEAQIEDHIQDVNDAEDEKEIGVNAALRAFARRTVPVYCTHAQIWRRIAPSVGVPPLLGRPTESQILRRGE